MPIEDLYNELRGIPLKFGPYAGFGIIDSIKRAYAELEADAARQPKRDADMGVRAEPEPRSPQLEGDAPGPAQDEGLPDEAIAQAFADPAQRFAAFIAKYQGQELPPSVANHFSLLDELTLKEM